ncbi:hypothetical protein ACFL2U_01090 [Patescibacteria group bacterium]
MLNLKSDNLIVPNPDKLNNLVEKFQEQGTANIHVLADFDRTLTNCFVNGEKITSIIAILRKEGYLNEEYTKVTTDLFDKYHPIEIDPQIPAEEKKQKMDEWWRAHNDELIKHGLNKDHLDKVIASSKIQFRAGALEFLDILKQQQIPVVIMSSSGLGNYVITRLLKKQNKMTAGVHIISNQMEFDEQGTVIGFSEPIIHVLNKDETILADFPAYEQVKNRKNVILLGDNIEDVGMVAGFEYDNLIKIGFLNDKVDELADQYKENFDLIITNDSNMNIINELLNQFNNK